jgi:hypothetical protein
LKLAAESADGLSDLKGSVAAIHFMVSNAAKFDVDEQSLVQEIQQLGLPKDNADNIGKAYLQHKEALRELFDKSTFKLAQLLKTEWRVDYMISSSTNANEGTGNDTDISSIINMKLTVDNKPKHEKMDSIELMKEKLLLEKSQSSRVEEITFQMSSDKLDILVHELTNVSTILRRMQN